MIGHYSYQSDLEAASEHILQLLEQSTKEVVGTTCILSNNHKYDSIPFQCACTSVGMRLPELSVVYLYMYTTRNTVSINQAVFFSEGS